MRKSLLKMTFLLDVGPSLGIAKSSSLESLQTAMENCKHHQQDLPAPRPLTKVLRHFNA